MDDRPEARLPYAMTVSFERIAIIDIGKTNAKVVIVDARTGAEVAVRKTANIVLAGPPYPHFDTERLWTFILETLFEFAGHPGFDALSITTHGATAALLDDKGALALPVLDYEYVYPDEVNRAYDLIRPNFDESFSPRLTGGLNLGAQFHFQRDRFPQEFARVSTILTLPQYWAFRLTGVAANEKTSLGCHTDLWRPFADSYSALVDRLDIADKMAPIRSAFDILSDIRPEIAQKIGLSKSVPVYCGIHDSNASLLPHLVDFGLPCTVVSTGTWVICFAPGAKPDALDSKRDTLANVDAYGTAVPSARYMGGREWEIVTKDLAAVTAEAEWAAVADVVSHKRMLLPSSVSGTGPFPQMKGRWHLEPENAAERRAAASLYQSLMTVTCLDMISSQGPIIVEGPFTSNRVFVAALHSLTGRPVYASPSQTGTSSGAALLAGIRPSSPLRLVNETIPGLDNYSATWREMIESEISR
ncbi:FGGY-family carbohydrate kinase [Rhizobium ipomoeae]|nr:FGGY-family carbohydrate kinase [Rhizobium sp. 'Codium 1']MCC8932776.1 FGGY-family carbohydrate kinase [Rhizobium sp. 'Codium 1']